MESAVRHVLNFIDDLGNDRVMVVRILEKTAKTLLVECRGQHHAFDIANILQLVAIDGPDSTNLLDV